MPLLSTLLGAALIALALRDMWHTLFRPGGGGTISQLLPRAVWPAFRSLATRRPALLVLAGPVAFSLVIAGWAGLLVVGWALLYWPHLPGQFLLAPGLDPAAQGGFPDALYLSLVTLATLGYGDIAPTAVWLRVLAPVEALVGFVLLTASLSWALSSFPVLARRRALAHQLTLLREAHAQSGIGLRDLGPEAAERLLSGLAAQVISVRRDLLQFPITYYFHSSDDRSALSRELPRLARLAREGTGEDWTAEARLQAILLDAAVRDFAAVLAREFLRLPGAPTEAVLAAYARDHRRRVELSSDRTTEDDSPR